MRSLGKNLTTRSALRVLGSTALWLVVLLLLLQPALCSIDPLAYLQYDKVHPFQQIQRSVAYKYNQFASGKSPDLLITGSSLTMCSIYYWDSASRKEEFATTAASTQKLNINTMQSYNAAHYLTDQLSKKEGRPISIYNLAIAASMVSDTDAMLSRILKSNKRPKVIVYGIFPRDFADNLVPPLGSTPVFKAIGDWRDVLTLGPRMASDTIQDLCIFSLCSYYRVRTNFQAWITDATAHFMHRPRTLAESTDFKDEPDAKQQSTAPATPMPGNEAGTASITMSDSKTKARLALMTRDYYNRYNPPDKARFQQEVNCFRHLLTSCKQAGVRVIVINMPVSSIGRSVITDASYDEYLRAVTATTRECGTDFVDLEKEGVYKDNEFIDIVHLNEVGGEHFQNQLIGILENMKVL